ncbi:MAG: hypothetical protein VCC04_13570, partial [Myxococcota bacterium]
EARLPHPGEAGAYEICFGLVQIRDASPVPMRIEPVALDMELIGLGSEGKAVETNASPEWSSESSEVCRNLLATIRD